MSSTNEESNEQAMGEATNMDSPTPPTWPLPTPPQSASSVPEETAEVAPSAPTSEPNWELADNTEGISPAPTAPSWPRSEDDDAEELIATPSQKSGLKGLIAVAAVASLIGGFVGATTRGVSTAYVVSTTVACTEETSPPSG
jgi:hypothetical protein